MNARSRLPADGNWDVRLPTKGPSSHRPTTQFIGIFRLCQPDVARVFSGPWQKINPGNPLLDMNKLFDAYLGAMWSVCMHVHPSETRQVRREGQTVHRMHVM